jgi:glycosyltransferase involved in cell wall biosynthesis
MPKIAAVMMVKNEARRVHVTLDSIAALDGLIVFDTGSEDGTPELIERLSPIPVHTKRGAFVDFATSMNVLMDYADECAVEHGYEFYILLDANDEYVGERPSDAELAAADVDSWYIERRLKYTQHDATSFWNVKLVRASRPTQRYAGVVYEYLRDCGKTMRCSAFHIFQDRTLDDDKSAKRWLRDRVLLERETAVHPEDTRSLFYLAQVYNCIGEWALAYAAYERRTRSIGGYEEERWYAMMQCGGLAQRAGLAWDVALAWYTRAFCADERVEPLVALAEHYADARDYRLAHAYAKLACELLWPADRLLFVERKPYDYTRWHLLGRTAYYVGKADAQRKDQLGDIEGRGGGGDDDAEATRRAVARAKATMAEGENACLRAIDAGCNVALDTANLACYLTT